MKSPAMCEMCAVFYFCVKNAKTIELIVKSALSRVKISLDMNNLLFPKVIRSLLFSSLFVPLYFKIQDLYCHKTYKDVIDIVNV